MTLPDFVAVDTETTGLDLENDRMIELAAVRFAGGEPVAEFTALLPTERALSAYSRLITGIDPAELETAPVAAETLRAFLDFVGDLPLVAHNASFDESFVRRSLEAEGLSTPPGPWLDSLLIARIAWPSWDSHRLDSLAERLNVPREGEHRALPDARRAGRVFIAALNHARASLSQAAWKDLCGLAEDLPGWSAVLAGDGGNESGEPLTEGNDAQAAPVFGDACGDAASRASEALRAEQWLLLETPAGCDDSMAGLRAALQAADDGKRVLLAVPDTHAWNALRKSSGARAGGGRVVALAPPSGYLNRARLRSLLARPSAVPVEERGDLMVLVAWADRNPAGPVADGRGFSPERARLLWLRVCCDTYAEDAAARAARAAAESAGVILVTQDTLCAHIRLEGALLPPCDALFVAGAHRLPLAAGRAAGREITFFRLRQALQLVRSSAEREDGLWTTLARRLPDDEAAEWAPRWHEPERRFQKLLQKAGRHAAKTRASGEFRVRYTEPAALAFGVNPEPVLEALKDAEDFLERLAALPAPDEEAFAGREALRIAGMLHGFRIDFETLCDARDAGQAHWFEDVSNPHKAAFRSAPVDMEPFGEALREHYGGGALLSPALLGGAQGSPQERHVATLLGLDAPGRDIEVARAGSPPQARFLLAPFAASYSGAETAGAYARFLIETAGPFVDQGLLVYFPSQTVLRHVRHALREQLPEGTPLWAQFVDGNREALQRLYATGTGGWVLATEGLPDLRDAAGASPSLFLITRMPLPSHRDPLFDARAEVVRERGGNARSLLWHPAAVLRLKQEWTALHRKGAGPVAAWLLDARASGDGLGARAAKALGCAGEACADAETLRAATHAAIGGTVPG